MFAMHGGSRVPFLGFLEGSWAASLLFFVSGREGRGEGFVGNVCRFSVISSSFWDGGVLFVPQR